MEQQQLREVIASAQAGRLDAFDVLLDAYGPRLYGFFYRATRDTHDAEDLLGELTLRLVGQLKRYRHRGRFEPWLFRMAANMVRDRARRKRIRGAQLSLTSGDEDGEPLAERLAGPGGSAEAKVLKDEASALLNEALGRLDPHTRTVILLRHFGQMSFKEIAETTGSPLGTVLARAHRGLGELRRCLGGYDATE